MKRLTLTALACAALGLSLTTSANATPLAMQHLADGHTRIVGGTVVATQADAPGLVHLSAQFRVMSCGAVRLSPTWVLTARHCVDGKHVSPAPTKVFTNTLKSGKGPSVDIARIVLAPEGGDVALVELKDGTVAGTTAPWTAAKPAVGATCTQFGWGGTKPDQLPSPDLKTGQCTVTGYARNFFYPGGEDVVAKGVNGVVYVGDSGSPLFVDGKVVAVVSGGGHKGTDPTASANFAMTSAVAAWIQQTSGVAPTP